MMRVPFILCFFFIFFSGKVLLAADSTAAPDVPTRLGYYYENAFRSGKFQLQSIDTGLTLFRQTNKALLKRYNYLGTLGSAADPQVFSMNQSASTYVGLRSFQLYTRNAENEAYYKTNKRFTQIDWHTGAFREQAIHVLHTQNITKNWNAGIDFTRLGVKDFMAFSRTFHNDLSVFSSYQSKNGRYNLFANINWLTIRNQVNGGVPNDSLFLYGNIANLDIKGLGFSISGATQRFHHRQAYVSQYYTIRNRADSLSPGFRLNYTISAERFTYAYRDATPDSSFYTNFYSGSETNDTLHSDQLTNRFSIALPAGKRKVLPNWNTEYFIRHQHVKYGMLTTANWNNLTAGGIIQLLTDSSFRLKVQGEIVVQGFDQGNTIVQGDLSLPLSKLARLSAGIVSGRASADYQFRFAESNNFIWKKDFDKINFISLTGGLTFPKWRTGIQLTQHVIDRWVFMNAEFSPEQLSKVTTITQAKLVKDFTYRKLHFDNYVIWQNSSQSAIRLPQLTSSHSVYIEKYLFKKAMLANFGLACDFNSSYFSNSYMPSNSLFFLQNEIKTGGFARVDLFIDFRIKTARIFVLMENVADNLTGQAYYLTPHQPMPGRVLKFGISWRFFD